MSQLKAHDARLHVAQHRHHAHTKSKKQKFNAGVC